MKTYKEEASLCSSSLPTEPAKETLSDAGLSAKSKTDAFLSYVGYLNSLGQRLMLSDKAENMALRFFKDSPAKAVSELTDLIDDCISFSFNLKPHDSGYDEHFNIRRSHNLSFFFDHLAAITTEVNTLKAQIGV